MRAFSTVMVLVACRRELAQKDPAEPLTVQPVAITKRAPRVGDGARETRTLEMTLTAFDTDGSPIVRRYVREEERTEEILAVDGGAVTKLRVSYPRYRETNDPGKVSSLLEGHTFILATRHPGFDVTLEGSSPTSAAEEWLVRDDYASFGEVDALRAVLADGPVRVGDTALGIAGAAIAGWKIKPYAPRREETVVTSTDRGVVTFRVRAQITVRLPTPIDGELGGTLSVRASDGSLAAYDVRTSVELDPDAGAKIPGSVVLRGTLTRSHRR